MTHLINSYYFLLTSPFFWTFFNENNKPTQGWKTSDALKMNSSSSSSFERNSTTTIDSKEEVKVEETSTAEETGVSFEWTTVAIVQSIFLFCLAGVAEILGGWFVWAAIRGSNGSKKPWWYAVIGSFILILYGFIPCFQPTDSFGRIYAAYGGFFIVLSFLFGWALDGDKPDKGDVVGGCISMLGVGVILFWPRTNTND